MDDVANVWLVDPHAEGTRRDHDQASRRQHELALGCDPIRSAHLAVISHHWYGRPLEGACELINRGGRGAIYDPGPLQ